jgi:Pvc16 N-terminal domain
MALSPAIAATSQAILGLVQSASLGGEFQSATFAHYQSSNFQSPMGEGVSLWLYRLTVNANRNQPPRVGRDGRRYRPPLPLDLHYVVTAWAGDAVKQQRLLGFAIRTLEDTPILPAGVLNQHGPEPDVFRPDETVELVFESISVQDASYIWGVAQTKEQPSAMYVARMVEIESSVPLDDAAPAQTREFQWAEVTVP